MLGQRRPYDLPLTLGNVMSDIVANVPRDGHPEIMHHGKGFDFVPANRSGIGGLPMRWYGGGQPKNYRPAQGLLLLDYELTFHINYELNHYRLKPVGSECW